MKIINGERASGRTTMLIQMAHETGARIVCRSQMEARFVEKRAAEMGLEIKKPAFDFGAPRAFNPETFKGETLLIDGAEEIVEKALAAYFGVPVTAITINCTNVLKSRLDDEQREIAKAGYTKQITPDEAQKPPCKECRFYVSDEQRDKCGFCGQNDENVGAYDRKGCFEKKLLCGDCQFFVPTEEKSAELPFSNGYCGGSIDKNRVWRTKGPCNRFQIRTSKVKPKPAPHKSDKSENDAGICNKCQNSRTLPNTGNIYCGRFKEEKHFKTIGCSGYAEKSCGNCFFSKENDHPSPSTVTCTFNPTNNVLRPRDGACWTCERYSKGIKP